MSPSIKLLSVEFVPPPITMSPPSYRVMSANITKKATMVMYPIDAPFDVAVHAHEQALHSMVAPHEPAREPQQDAATAKGAEITPPISDL